MTLSDNLEKAPLKTFPKMNSFSMSLMAGVFIGYLALGLDAGGVIPFTR